MDKLEPGNPDQAGYGYEGEFDNEPCSLWWEPIDSDTKWQGEQKENSDGDLPLF